MATNKTPIFTWVVENLQPCNESEFVELIEIKKKCEFEVTSAAVGNVIKKVFNNVKIKGGRLKENWCKSTQRYYGLSWKQDTISQPSIIFIDIQTLLPEDYFVISKTKTSMKIGHFTGEIINDNKIMIEIQLEADGGISLQVMGKKIELEKIGLHEKFSMTVNSVESLFQEIKQLRYCSGVNSVEQDLPHFEEQVCLVGHENSEQIRFRAKTCCKVLPFKISHAASLCCGNCKKLKTKVNNNDINLNENNTHDNEVILGETNHNDLSDLLTKIFPDCSMKMQTFLLSQKMALERNPNGRRWNREIMQLCLTLYCRSPRGYRELRNSNFIILPSPSLLRGYKNSVYQEAGINSDMLDWTANEATIEGIPFKSDCIPYPDESDVSGTDAKPISNIIVSVAPQTMDSEVPGPSNVASTSTDSLASELQPTIQNKDKIQSKKRKTSRRGKGKGKGKSRKKNIPISDDKCTVCKKPDIGDEDWICCDACTLWYHRDCANLQDDEIRNSLSEEGAVFTCPLCQL